jgi:lambda family phage tail tape measure protein
VATLGGAIGDLIIKSSGAKTIADSFKLVDNALSQVSVTAQQFDMKNMIEQFNAADANVRKGILSLVEYRKIAAELAGEETAKALQKELTDVVSPGFLRRMVGDFSASDLGLKPEVATDFFAEVRSGTTEASILAQKYGADLARGNEKAKALAETINKAAMAQQSLANATSAMSRFQQSAAVAGATGKIAVPGAKDKMTPEERLAKQQMESADKFVDSLQRQTAQLEHNKQMIGMTTQEVELLNAQYKIQADLEKAIQDIERQGTKMKQGDLERMKAAAQEAEAAQRAILEKSFARQQDPMMGIKDAMTALQNEANNVAGSMQRVFTKAFDSMANGIVQFAMTGKMNFADFANSLVADIMRIYVRMALLSAMKPLMPAGFALAGFAEGGYTGDGGKNEAAGIVHKGEFVMTKEATNRIGVGTLYRMMRGYAEGGLVGGSMPAMGNGADGGVVINIKNEAGADGYKASATARKNDTGFNIDVLVRKAVTDDMRNNGPMSQTISATYGLRRST